MRINDWFYEYCRNRDFLYEKDRRDSIVLNFWHKEVFMSQSFNSFEEAKRFVDAV